MPYTGTAQSMSTAEILFLGAIAGFTIFLGLPLGRMQRVSQGAKAFLSATATGILLFLFWDVTSAAVEPVESALTAGRDGRFVFLAALLGGGFAVGLLSLVYYDGWMKRRRRQAFLGPGAASTAEFERHDHFYGSMSPARWLAVFIATGIGLHNFSEGLAIGQSAARDELSLAIVLIIGFGLHNATEGFGIVAPLSGEAEPPTWRFLATMGLIGGGPTFLGTVLGQAWTSTPVSILFLALAAGSILYVVVELLNVCRLFGQKAIVTWGVLLGLFLGFATDFVLVAAGA
jgi:ZIP family zinc transporter